MMKNNVLPMVLMASLLALVSCVSKTAEKQKKSDSLNPADNLPPHITRLTYFGQRADWSHDGKKILFLAKTFGDVYEVEINTGIIRPVTHHFYHEGYVRALYLSNGDILLSGAKKFDAENPLNIWGIVKESEIKFEKINKRKKKYEIRISVLDQLNNESKLSDPVILKL